MNLESKPIKAAPCYEHITKVWRGCYWQFCVTEIIAAACKLTCRQANNYWHELRRCLQKTSDPCLLKTDRLVIVGKDGSLRKKEFVTAPQALHILGELPDEIDAGLGHWLLRFDSTHPGYQMTRGSSAARW
jgi:hypothetical protein